MATKYKAKSTDVEITRAIIYTRVSTDKQGDTGLGLADQEKRCRAYCMSHGWEVEQILSDTMSAKTLDRPQFEKAIAALCPGTILLALKFDRLCRTAADLDTFTGKVHAAGGEWATVEGNYDTSTAMGRFMIRIIADVAQMEREVTGERTSAAMHAKKDRNEFMGTPPLGYKVIVKADGTKGIEQDEEEMKTVNMIRDLKKEGKKLTHICRALEAAGRKTKRGADWQACTVANILKQKYDWAV